MASRRELARRYLGELRDIRGEAAITDDLLDRQAVQASSAAKRLASSVGRPQILRDPVGTGKTAVALAAARLLLADGHARYVLVIAPNKAVAAQWADRASGMFASCDDVTVEAELTAVWRVRRIAVATHSTHPHRHSPRPADTLVIIDESHRGLQNLDAMAFEGARQSARGTMTLLVTATPYRMTTTGFTTMLSVAGELDEGASDSLRAYGRAVSGLLGQWDARGEEALTTTEVARVEALRDRAAGVLDRHLLPRTTVQPPPHPKLRPETVPLGQWAEAYAVARVLPELIGSGKNDAYQRGLASSSETVWDEHNRVGQRLAELRQSRDHRIADFLDELHSAMGTGARHPKIAATVKWVKEQVGHGHHVVVFTSWVPTQQAIGHALATEVGDVHAPTGATIDCGYRKRFMAPPNGKPVVLVLTDRFSESIDLDGGHPSLVHHDLSWNPVRITQRWGRVVRVRTNFRPIPSERIYVPLLEVEVEHRLLRAAQGRQDLAGAMVPTRASGDGDAWMLPDDVLKRIATDFDLRHNGSAT